MPIANLHAARVVLALVVIAGAACAQPPAAPAAAAATLPMLKAPRPGLYTAGQPAAADWALLARDHGIATVINLRPDAEQPGRDETAEVRAAGLRYAQVPVAGAGEVTTDKADTLWRQLEQARGPVLVHCASGNRVGALLAIGAARRGGMSPGEALAFGRRAGLTSLEPKVREVLGLAAEAP